MSPISVVGPPRGTSGVSRPIASSSLPTTSGSLATASTTVSARTALSDEYDVRRHAASTVRVKARTPSSGISSTGPGPARL